jgi:hypothetical protein
VAKQSYQQYLRSDHWKELRRKCKSGPYYRKCFICGYSEDKFIPKNDYYNADGELVEYDPDNDLSDDYKIKVVLHHCNYKNLWHESAHDIIPLCEDCHETLHMICKRFPDFINKSAKSTKIEPCLVLPLKVRYPDGIAFIDLHEVMKNDSSIRRMFE